MAGGSQQEFELQETPRLCPRFPYKDVGGTWVQIDPGTDHKADDLWERGLHAGLVGYAEGGKGEDEEGVDETPRELGALDFLTQGS